MKPQEELEVDPTQPRTVKDSIDRPYTENIAGFRLLEARYSIPNPQEESEPVVSWKEGFQGGPEILIHEPGGKRRPANDGDFKQRHFTASDTEESEGESSVISVHDLGFSAAPAVSLQGFRDFHTLLEKNQGHSKTEHFMSVSELRRHLGYNEGAADTIEQLVGEKIEKSFEKSKKDDEDYLPLDAFEAILCTETIKSLVKEAHPESTKPAWQNMVARIVGTEPNQGYRRILGVLVLMSKVPYINDFIREGVGDYDLPIARSRDDNKDFKTRRGAKNSTLFRGWRHRNDIELFYIYQKKIFVPFFDIQEDKLCSYVFEGNVTLPWKDYKQKTSGGNGLVHKVQIHSKHHNFKTPSPEKPLYFALKEISALDRDAYRRELRALEKSALRTQKEKHLIKLLLTFQHGDVCYLLFEWADGNLAEFWEQPDITPAPSDTWAITKEEEKQFSSQLLKRCTPFVDQMLDLVHDGMLVVDPKKRLKIDQVCTEISRIKGSLEPTTELTHAVDVTLRAATQEFPSDDRPSMEPDALQTDSLVQHAQGNSVGILANVWRQRALSIRSESGDSDEARDRSAAKSSSLTIDQLEQDTRLQNMHSKGTQTAFDNAQFVTADSQNCSHRTKTGIASPGRSVARIDSLDEQASHTDREQ
ncbi:hypothetical protein DL768_011348 [Monosporascus sp. mg162]|nr:hypothetical protein DL768_011348 [Monosporascus sp. mg162]